MKTLYVMCGIPGSGKSTKSRQLAEEYGLTRFSFDEMRCYTTRQFASHAVASLHDGKSVVLDSTHLREAGRKVILQAVENIPCRKVCVFMNTPLEECKRRNANRTARVSDRMIDSMYSTMQPPALSEGWDEIIVI